MPLQTSQKQFDLVVIGAGINGAGIARDAAMRGLSVLLLDKGDIGGGTSSWSTRLIHGGLRYLEYGEFSLVRESLRERECLLHIAPHLVRPLPLLVPMYKDSRRGPSTIRAGMLAYDVLSFGKTLPNHRMFSRAEALGRLPGLEPEGLVGAAVYYDAQVEFAERLVLENAIAAAEHGAEVLTYCHVDKLIVDNGAVRGIEFARALGNSPTVIESINIRTGSRPGPPRGQPAWGGGCDRVRPEEERQAVSARLVINAAGPWVDQLLQSTSLSSRQLIGGTKGSHIVVAAFPGAPATSIYVEAKVDQRPFFIIPWNGNYLIGTTDFRYHGDLDHVEINDEEVDYLLRETNRVIPAAKLERSKILYTYSGVRPLPFTDDRAEKSITRRHFISEHPELSNLLSIVGGKLTTYRNLAEETVDLIFRKLGKPVPKCTTDHQPLPGANASNLQQFGQNFKERSGLPELISDRLLRIYGVRSAEVLELTVADPSLLEVFDDETQAIAAEVVYSFQNEMAQTLADCLLRRTMVGLNSTCGRNALEAAAKIAQTHLGWSDDKVSEEVLSYRNYVERFGLNRDVVHSVI